MRKVTRAALALAGSAALIGVATVPSFAADTTTTVVVPAGVLSITAPATATLVTAAVAPGADSSVTLGATKVTDERAGTAGWIATVSLPVLSDSATTPKTIPTTSATYLAATATLTGAPTVAAPSTVTGLSTAKTSQSATAVSGNNTASWTATLTVPIPAQALASTYTGTMTQSVS